MDVRHSGSAALGAAIPTIHWRSWRTIMALRTTPFGTPIIPGLVGGPALLRMGTADGQITANGKPFLTKGIVWWGAESARAVPGGLEKRALDDILSLLSKAGFNALSASPLPFLRSLEMIRRSLRRTAAMTLCWIDSLSPWRQNCPSSTSTFSSTIISLRPPLTPR